MTRYLTADEVKAYNSRFLGIVRLRDESGLQSAIARPQTVAYYQGADIAFHAAVLIEGIAMTHPFIDANKRTAALAALVCIDLNGWRLDYHQSDTEDEFGGHILTLVTHQETTEQLAQWMRQHLIHLP